MPEMVPLAPGVSEALNWVIFTDPLVREDARAVLRHQLSLVGEAEGGRGAVPIVEGLLDQATRCPPGVEPEPLLAMVAEALSGGHRAMLRAAPGGRLRPGRGAILAAVQARLPQLRAWLYADRPGLRAHAALILACMATSNPIPAEHLAGRLQQETDRAVAGTLLLCLGLQSLWTMLPVRALRLLQKGWSDPLNAACALLARTFVEGRALDEGAEPLCMALREGWIDAQRFPLREGDLAGVLVDRSAWLGAGVRARLRAELPGLIERHREGPQQSWLELLLELSLGPPPGEAREIEAGAGGPVEPLTADRLEGELRQVLVRLTGLGVVSEVFARYGLPVDVAGRQRLLGLAAPGVLERLVAPEQVGLPADLERGPQPLYELLLAMQGEIEEETLFERLSGVLAPVERAALCAELRRRPYGLRVPLGRTILMVAASVEDEEMPALQQVLTDLLTEHRARGRLPPGTGEGLVGNALLARYLDSMPGERQIPEEMVPLIALVPPPEVARELLSALPPEAREPVMLPKIEQGTDLALSWLVELLPLCPTARLVDAFVCSVERVRFPVFRAEIARKMEQQAADLAGGEGGEGGEPGEEGVGRPDPAGAALLAAGAARILRGVPPEDGEGDEAGEAEPL